MSALDVHPALRQRRFAMPPATPEQLFARFDALGIAHVTHRHAPVFTVAESAEIKANLPGGHSKNLFLKDKKGRLYLLCALGDAKVDLNAVAKLIGASGRFTFCNAELLMQHLESLLKKDDVKSLFIEVAISNHAALALYASSGFENAGTRKNYYERGNGSHEDALIMRKGL